MEARAVRQTATTFPSTWRTLLAAAGVITLVLLLLAAAVLGDVEAFGIAVGFGIGLGLLPLRRGLAGKIVLGLLFLDVAAFMLPAVSNNVSSGAGFGAVGFPAALSAASLVGVVAAGFALVRRQGEHVPARGPRVVFYAGAVIFLALIGAGAVTRDAGAPIAADAIRITSSNVAFSPTELLADAGEVTVALANEDLFWHTFTIDELAVDLWVPVRGRQAATFAAAPGTYEFYCAIPGHAEAGMRGLLVVDSASAGAGQ